MSEYFTEDGSVEAVNGRMSPDIDPRLHEVMSSLVRHLHAFVKDVELTETEWKQAIDFLTQTGQICSDSRQEFILLSDVLGVSMLVDAINHRSPEGTTETTVFGPFHVNNAPERQLGDTISLDGKGEICRYFGRVLDVEGQPVVGAWLDVWSDNDEGFYDVQQPGIQPPMNNRGIFHTDDQGRYWFRGIKPVSYPIPNDGPVGRMLEQLGRHPYRPAHMHFLVGADGFDGVTTHIFVAGDGYLESDAVFGVKESLIVDFRETGKLDCPWEAEFDFILRRKP